MRLFTPEDPAMVPEPARGQEAFGNRSGAGSAAANRVFIDSLLFLSSFAPLFGLLALRFTERYLQVICGFLFVLGTGALLVVLRAARSRKTPERMTPITIDDKGADVSGYLATYLLPFLVLPDPTVADQVAYVAFLIIAGAIYVRSRMLQINPTLYLFRKRVFWIDQSSEGFRGYLIADGDVDPGVARTVVRLRDGLLVDAG